MSDLKQVNLQLCDTKMTAESGRRVFDVLTEHDVVIHNACGGLGLCHLCRFEVLSGDASLNPPSPIEQRALGEVLLSQNIRLACQAMLRASCSIHIPGSAEGSTPSEEKGEL